MKKLFAMLIALCCTFNVSMAVEATFPQVSPQNVKECINEILSNYGIQSSHTLNTKRDPTSQQLEMKVETIEFKCSSDAQILDKTRMAYILDEPCGYQMIHILPGQSELVNINVIGNVISELNVRTNMDQEFLMLNVKNTENPRLRDCYAIVWQTDDKEQNMVKGKIFTITSMRPELLSEYELLQQTSKTFTIEGAVDEAIADSCYNIYIAGSHSEITDDNLVACVPVVDKKFHYSVNLDKMKAGRLRCIFPGGELCSAYIDLYFIPGMTLKLTVHDNYYHLENQNVYNKMVAKELENDLQLQQEEQDMETSEMRKNYERKVNAYREALNRISNQITELREQYKNEHSKNNRKTIEKRLKSLHKQADKITRKMNKFIIEHVESMK